MVTVSYRGRGAQGQPESRPGDATREAGRHLSQSGLVAREARGREEAGIDPVSPQDSPSDAKGGPECAETAVLDGTKA